MDWRFAWEAMPSKEWSRTFITMAFTREEVRSIGPHWLLGILNLFASHIGSMNEYRVDPAILVGILSGHCISECIEIVKAKVRVLAISLTII